MPIARLSEVELWYEERGPAGAPAVLFIMGLGTQAIAWPPELVQAVVDAGYRAIVFDNRDVGLSTHLAERVDAMAVLQQVAAGERPDVPYTLSDMARDAVELLDHLGVVDAHVVGVSLGGFIAQTMAIEHRTRVRSLASIMSSTGAADVGFAHPEVVPVLWRPRPTDREAAIEDAVAAWRVIGTPGMVDEGRIRDLATIAYERGHDPAGIARQLAATFASGDRTEALRTLDIPTVVIHGTADRLVDPSGGEATAAAIAGAELVMIEGMGHDLPPAHLPRIVDALLALFRRADTLVR